MKKAITAAIAAVTICYMFFGCGGYAALGSTSVSSLFVIDTFATGHPHWLYVIEIELFVLHMIVVYQVRQSLCA